MVSRRGRLASEGDAAPLTLSGALRIVGRLNAGFSLVERQRLVGLLRQGGVSVVGPDVVRSGPDWEVALGEGLLGGSGPLDGDPSPIVVRCGLRQVTALSEGCIDRLVAARKAAAFRDAFDFLARSAPDEMELSSLVRSGALDLLSSGLTRPQLLWLLSTVRCSGQRPLFPERLPRCLSDYAPASKLRDEREMLGLSLPNGPASLHRRPGSSPQRAPADAPVRGEPLPQP